MIINCKYDDGLRFGDRTVFVFLHGRKNYTYSLMMHSKCSTLELVCDATKNYIRRFEEDYWVE